jgi:hypothetical protein
MMNNREKEQKAQKEETLPFALFSVFMQLK